MHFFGAIGSLLFLIGFALAVFLGVSKLIDLLQGNPAPLLASRAEFFISLTTMIIGAQFFLAGFVAEMIGRNSSSRNTYLIEKEI
jgi:hypothetical protein